MLSVHAVYWTELLYELPKPFGISGFADDGLQEKRLDSNQLCNEWAHVFPSSIKPRRAFFELFS